MNDRISSLYSDIITGKVEMNAKYGKNYELMKMLCLYDGSYLRYTDASILDGELVKVSMSHTDKTRNYSMNLFDPFYYIISANESAMNYLVEWDGNFLNYIDSSILSIPLLEKALNNKDPKKRLDISTEEFSSIRKSKEAMLYLIKKDGRNLKYVYPKIIDDDLINEALKHEDIKNDYDFQEEIFKKFGNEQNRKLDAFQFMLKGICKKYGLDIDIVNYHFERLSRINDDVYNTINFEFLNQRYEKLYLENGYEKLYVMVTYPDVQKEILDVLNPLDKKTKEIDLELGKKRLDLLNKMLKSSVRKKDGTILKDWIPYYASVITSFSDNISFYDKLLESDELSNTDIDTLTTYTLGAHKFPISTIDDLRNYDKVRNDYIEDVLKNSKSLSAVKDALFEKLYGLSYDKAMSIYIPYHNAIENSPDDFPDSVVSFYKDLKMIINEMNINVLKNSSYSRSTNVSEYQVATVKSVLKRIIVNNYNNNVFSVENKKPSFKMDGINFYKAAGEDGTEEFSMIIHALGAYSGFYPEDKGFNYYDDWNRPQILSHGLCTSLIGNNNLGTARINFSVLGFTNFEEGSLLLGANGDIVSSAANVKFDTSSEETGRNTGKNSNYFLTKDMLDYTRHTHNELVFERRVRGNKKKQPSYIVYFCDDFDNVEKLYKKGINDYEEGSDISTFYYTLQTAKDFGLPIVIVEREKIAKHEFLKIKNSLEEFICLNEDDIDRDAVKKYYHDIIVEFENNHTGNREYHTNIDNQYFSRYYYDVMISDIQKKIRSVSNEDIKLMMVEELDNLIKLEKEKFGKRANASDLDKFNYVTKMCNEIRKEIEDYKEKEFKPLYIRELFDNKIASDKYISDYKSIDIEEDQLDAPLVLKSIDGKLKNKIFESVKDIYDNDVYSSSGGSHSTRHIEDVILFSAIIGKGVNLDNHEMDLLLEAAKYHDCGRINDRHEEHAILGALKARDYLKDSYSKEDINIIATAISYHELHDDKEAFIRICKNNGLDITNKKIMDTALRIASCLKDADALDRTRFSSSSRAFVNQDMLRFDISKKLIKLGEQINESYAISDILQIVNEDPINGVMLLEELEKVNNPKDVIRAFRKGNYSKGGKDGR